MNANQDNGNAPEIDNVHGENANGSSNRYVRAA